MSSTTGLRIGKKTVREKHIQDKLISKFQN